jgi:hypothetical protein
MMAKGTLPNVTFMMHSLRRWAKRKDLHQCRITLSHLSYLSVGG